MAENAASGNRKYKDRLFNFIFGREENREWTLSLYNAINGSHYTDASSIEFNTLEDALYMGMRNDTSFIVSDTVNIYEHQSSYNPNMPLRMMEYLDKMYAGYVKANGFYKYSSFLIPLPTPRLVVFYNGKTDEPDEKVLRLSDSFSEETSSLTDVEITVRMLNINYGHNRKIMECCKPLNEYAWFVDRIRQGKNNRLSLEEAMADAIQNMPDDYSIKEFLVKQRGEIMGLIDTEYDEEEIRKTFIEEGRREERANTERERARADREHARAEVLEERIRLLEEKLASISDK